MMYNTAIIKKRLRTLKITQKHIALELGINVNTFNQYINNRIEQPTKLSVALADKLGINDLSEFKEYFCVNHTALDS